MWYVGIMRLTLVERFALVIGVVLSMETRASSNNTNLRKHENKSINHTSKCKNTSAEHKKFILDRHILDVHNATKPLLNS